MSEAGGLELDAVEKEKTLIVPGVRMDQPQERKMAMEQTNKYPTLKRTECFQYSKNV